jgi:hypothetical protein
MRIAIAAGKLNGLFLMVGAISSAYLEAFTLEKVCFIAGPEFGPLAGHLLTIVRALYGLRTSGARWHGGCMIALHMMSMSSSMLMTLCSLAKNHNSFLIL